MLIRSRLVAFSLFLFAALLIPSFAIAMYADGDVAPLGARDGVVNVGDALVTLRFALGLDTPSPEDVLHADVAPLNSEGQPEPDGLINVGDALVILRKAVGLETFEGLMVWTAPVLFSNIHEGFQNAKLVIDANERALLAWSKNSHVWASSSSDGVNWSTPEQVDDATSRAGLTALAMNTSGKAALVWRAEERDPADHFKARLYSSESGWEASTQFLDTLTGDGAGGAVDVNDSGDVMAVFTRYDASGHVWARSYTDAAGWDAAATRLDDQVRFSNSPDVAINSNGKATVVWEQWDGSRNQALARSYTPGSGWDVAVTALDGSTDPSIEKIRLSLGTAGDGLAHWTLADRSGVMARRLVNGIWQATEAVTSGANIYRSNARVAPDGRIVQTWADNKNVYARLCVDGVWAADATLVSDDAETVNLRTSVMTMDRANGRVMVMWTRLALDDADGSAVWARRYDPTDGWSSVEQVLPWTPGILYDVDDVVLLDDGRALAVLAGEDISVWAYSTFLISYR